MLILGISGKKQSGKTTSGNFILSVFMTNLNISKKIHIDNDGQIVISDLFGNEQYAGVFDLAKNINSTDYLIQKAIDTLNPHVKLYSFADPLKQNICMDMLGLSYNQCYGTDEDKNTLTSIRWENIPGYNTSSKYGSHDPSGFMTARQVMEIVGTNIFRSMKKDVWVNATLNKIAKEKPKLAIITDCRFPDEITAIKNQNGKTIRLTRSKFISDHESELVLDKDRYDWSNFDFIVENSETSIYDQCIELQNILTQLSKATS